MFRSKRIIGTMVVFVSAILLTACGAKATVDPNQKMTEIAATVQAQLTQSAPVIPTTTPSPVAPTTTMTITPVPPTATSEGALPTTPVVVPTQPGSTTTDNAIFVSDVTIPDGTTVKPGEQFTKTWQFQNTGKTTWTKDYAILYLEGNLQGRNGVLIFKLSKDVPPGEYADVSALFTAPAAAGNYSSYWKLYNTSGYVFGDAVSVSIKVGSPTTTVAPPTATTAPPTVTATKNVIIPTPTQSPTPETPTAEIPTEAP